MTVCASVLTQIEFLMTSKILNIHHIKCILGVSHMYDDMNCGLSVVIYDTMIYQWMRSHLFIDIDRNERLKLKPKTNVMI